jgi:phosphoserine aminotransferase
MSSDYLSRTIPWDRFDLIYGGAQKNLGPAGVTLVFVRRAVLADTNEQLASYLRYPVHAEARSLHNTPPVFSIWMTGKVLAWMEDQGGLTEMERLAATRSSMIYETIDESDGFYRSPVSTTDRSHMNVVFRLPSEDLESMFIAGAESEDMVGLKGHRSVGGIRASMYNAMPVEGVAALVKFMHEFRAAAA